MPITAKVLVKEAEAAVPWTIRDGSFFELPTEGEQYWYNRWAVRVEKIESSVPPRVHLVFDWPRDKQFHGLLPDDSHVIEAARDADDGIWSARVINTGAGSVVSEAEGDDCDAVIRSAVSGVISKAA
jgi:hypothetical protein